MMGAGVWTGTEMICTGSGDGVGLTHRYQKLHVTYEIAYLST